MEKKYDSIRIKEYLNFPTAESYMEYTKDFDYEETEFINLFLNRILLRMLLEDDEIVLEMEKDVELRFIASKGYGGIITIYQDKRFLPVCEYNEVDYDKVEHKLQTDYSSAGATYTPLKKYTILNKPIIQHTKFEWHKNSKGEKEKINFNKTLVDFTEDFLTFANVIDKEHEELVNLGIKMEQEKKNRLPKYKNPPPPPPRPKSRFLYE